VLPEPHDDAGELLTLDALQIVGKRCAASGTVIAFEPDARVCPRCERVYHKDHVPPTCDCGAPLQGAAKSSEPSESEDAHAV
jgi:hypothetical protein